MTTRRAARHAGTARAVIALLIALVIPTEQRGQAFVQLSTDADLSDAGDPLIDRESFTREPGREDVYRSALTETPSEYPTFTFEQRGVDSVVEAFEQDGDGIDRVQEQVASDVAASIAIERHANDIVESDLASNLAAGSEREKLALMERVSERTDRAISLHLNEAPGDLNASTVAALVVLQRKGRVLDAMGDTLAAGRSRAADRRNRALLDRLKATTAELAGIALSAPDARTASSHQQSIGALEARQERLEAALSERNAGFRVQSAPATVEAVQAAIPAEAALVEFVVFRPFDQGAEPRDAYGPPHYGAYVLRREQTPRGVDLGVVNEIDEVIEAFRDALHDPARADVKSRARALDRLVMMPLREWIGDAARLLVSPDGSLNLVPFEALLDEHGHYAIERYAISYLTSGRDLLRMRTPRANHSEALIIADPLYGEPDTIDMRRSDRRRSGHAPQATTAEADPSSMYFTPIGGTSEEGRAIKALFPEATLVTGKRATKAMLQQVDAPRILHIASHGFFLQNSARNGAQRALVESIRGTRVRTGNIEVENPLLRSGLALAGANLARDRRRDGILTALEAAGLNLWGTKLVTLSACDTGVGEVRNGEGVYGLRRAFALAGTETLVMSLWPVGDYASREAMVAYYRELSGGLGRGDALREVKLAMLKRRNRQHPFYWASFIQSGEWAALDGRR